MRYTTIIKTFIKKQITTVATISALSLTSISAYASDSFYWQDTASIPVTLSPMPLLLSSGRSEARLLTLDQSLFELGLSESGSVYAARGVEKLPEVTLPLPDGDDVVLKVKPTQVMAEGLAGKYPDLKTYKLIAMEQSSGITGRMEVTPQGVFVLLQTGDGKKVTIEPTSNGQYSSSWLQPGKDSKGHQEAVNNKRGSDYKLFPDFQEMGAVTTDRSLMHRKGNNKLDATVTLYRLAISATSGYVRANGGSKASAMRAIVSTINRINQVYERDVGMRFVLVANNDLLIAPEGVDFSGSMESMIEKNQALVDRVIGSNNYDVGHLFASHGGGLAYVKSACRSGVKAMGASGNLRVGDERYALEFVAHEIGHQFGAMHTFNSNQGLCSSSNRSDSSAFEPGSGSTIMSYAGICRGDNLQYHADAMFHIGSIQQISQHKNRYFESGCGTPLRSSNHQPEVNAGADYVIPANTPFELKGDARDSDRDVLVYTWQQQDSGKSSRMKEDRGNNALFRSYLPTAVKNRIFPKMSVLNHTEIARGETLPSTNRLMHFKFVAYDAMGVAASDSMVVRVVTDENRFGLDPISLASLIGNEEILLTWQVANTDLPPISCDAVDIALSIDNGEHFDYSLAKEIPNSGSAAVILPDVELGDKPVRLKLSCSNNIFFSLSHWRAEAVTQNHEAVNSKSFETHASYLATTNNSELSSINSLVQGGGSGSMGAGGSLSTYWMWMFVLSFGLSTLSRKQQ